MSTDRHLWWEKGIIYQVYPRSYRDSNSDGVGDLPGIFEKLEYLKWLGVDAVWISPVYPSPMADFGYDVSDYIGIHPLFGTLEDFDRVLNRAHELGMRLILDFVPNHTSDHHPWFLESRSSRDNPKRDWYLWMDPDENGNAPNNWLSAFGGPGWEYDDVTRQYYYHAFLKEQPDLNWRNLEVQHAMLDAMRFWLDRGVDGFRVDVMWHMIKDAQFRNNPRNPDYRPGLESPYNEFLPVFSTDQPEVHTIVALMRRLLNGYDERLLIGEIYLPIDKLVTYYGEDRGGAHLPFNFQLIVMQWDAARIGAAITSYEASLPPKGWPNWVLGNHDNARVATRIGTAQARVAAMLLLTLRGTPTLYYGDEIGMHDVHIPPDRVQDPQEKNVPGIGLGRDPERTPMQWNASKFAGFSDREPWLPLALDFESVNVNVQTDDETSLLTLYRRLIALRGSERALSVGDFAPLESVSDVLAYERRCDETCFYVVLNMGPTPQHVELGARKGTIVLSTVTGREGLAVQDRMDLLENEGVLIRAEP